MRRLVVAAALTVTLMPSGARAATDCAGPAGDPSPGTIEWIRRDLENAYCQTQRSVDTASNPAYATAAAEQVPVHNSGYDPFRAPSRWDGARGRFAEGRFTVRSGQPAETQLFAPLRDGSYPGVVIAPGAGVYKEMYLWAAQGLAEAGYVVMTFDVPVDTVATLEDALAFFLSGEQPFRSMVDAARIGLAGHSRGADAAVVVGQADPRVSAVVAWDNLAALPGVTWRVPALGINSDPETRPPGVRMPGVNAEPPDPHARDAGFRAMRDAGVDTMQVALRAGTHLEFSRGLWSSGSRLGERVAFHYTLAWFDRYLRGETGATGRLTADAFDASSDVHNISAGLFDPASARNVPHAISGLPVADRFSFYFRSGYFLEGGALRCDDLRRACTG